ncbi:MAG: nicotinate-nucleotide--dimethylbenzimidazole phosphoribosyltransferase [bacterium]
MKLLQEAVARIQPQDPSFRDEARRRLEQLTMPHWALGRLMDLAVELAGMTRSTRPSVERRVVVTMAADHGVVAEGVSKYPQEVTPQMVRNFLNGGAGINALARVARAQVVVVDMGVAAQIQELEQNTAFISRKIAPGTSNMARGPAMSKDQALASIETGISIAMDLASSFELLATGDMGIGNTTPSSAIVALLTGASVEEVTGRGTGVDDRQLAHKISVISKAIELNAPDPSDPMDVLSKVGGFEIGGIAGLILGCAACKKPVILDGFISTAGALIAQALCPVSTHYMISSHKSVEQGHRIALQRLGLKPLLDLDLRLGEGTGAALAMPLVEAAVRILTEVATFEEASMSKAADPERVE